MENASFPDGYNDYSRCWFASSYFESNVKIQLNTSKPKQDHACVPMTASKLSNEITNPTQTLLGDSMKMGSTSDLLELDETDTKKDLDDLVKESNK